VSYILVAELVPFGKEKEKVMSKEKIYTITITEKELNILKNDINIKSMLGKLKWDSAVIIRQIIYDSDKQCRKEKAE